MKTWSLRDEIIKRIKNGEIKVTKEKVDLVGDLAAHKSLVRKLERNAIRRAEGERIAREFRIDK